jgi:hypothetical protein
MRSPKLNFENMVPTLVTEVPSLRPLFRAHIRNQGEVLQHVFFGDLTRYVTSLLDLVSPPDGKDEIERILALMEKGLADGDPQVDNLIGVSFLENLDQTGPHYDKIALLLGPRLKASLRDMRRKMGFPD